MVKPESDNPLLAYHYDVTDPTAVGAYLITHSTAEFQLSGESVGMLEVPLMVQRAHGIYWHLVRLSLSNIDDVYAFLSEVRGYPNRGRDLMRFHRELSRFMCRSLHIENLRNAFAIAPNRNIDGPGGVASQFRVTRNAVYILLQSLGLSADHFRSGMATWEELIRSSAIVTPLVGALLKIPVVIPMNQRLSSDI